MIMFDFSLNIDSSSVIFKCVRLCCVCCKCFGYMMDECKLKGNELVCYGCGCEGVIWLKCFICKGKCKEDVLVVVVDGKVSF